MTDNQTQISDYELREFLAICLMMGGKFSGICQEPPDMMDGFLDAHVGINFFDPAEQRGFLTEYQAKTVDEDGYEFEDTWYEITPAGLEFLKGSKS